MPNGYLPKLKKKNMPKIAEKLKGNVFQTKASLYTRNKPFLIQQNEKKGQKKERKTPFALHRGK